MKATRWIGLVLLVMVQLCLLIETLAGQSKASPPKTMRMCVTVNGKTECNNLTWASEYYEARKDGKTKLESRYWITRWENGHVQMTGKTAYAIDGVFPLEASFDAQIGSDGTHIAGNLAWRVGYSASGTLPFTLTWSKDFSNAMGPQYAGQFQVPHRSKAHPNILLPDGSGEVYASFPDDIRAVLMPESITLPNDATMQVPDMLQGAAADHFLAFHDQIRAILMPQIRLRPQLAMQPCDDTKENDGPGVTNPNVALEIGKFALRHGEYARGHCWINHSSYLGSKRGPVILGVIYLMGWGRPIDKALAFRYFSGQYRTGDPWAAYFIDRCYREGIGTSVSPKYAAQVETSSLLSEGAQQVIESIGSDDLEKNRQEELADLNSNSDIFQKHCSTQTQFEIINKEPPHCSTTVNQRLLEERTKEIGDRYAAIE